MSTKHLHQGASEGKPANRKIWFAVCGDMFEHEVVGMQVAPPRPADPKKPSWPPFVVWQWLIKEAARQDRERVIKGKVIPLRRGQVAVSERYLANLTNWGRKAVRVFLERLERFGMVAAMAAPWGAATETVLVTTKGQASPKKGPTITVLTICNYDVYQHAPKRRGPQRAQQGPTRGPRLYIEDREDRKDISSSINPKGLDEESRSPLQLAPSLVDELRGVVGAQRAGELVAEYLASPYAKGARFINRAFKGWLRKGGIQITGHGTGAFKIADALDLCPRDARGHAVTTLPKAVTGNDDWRARYATSMGGGRR
jgi:hypothetical protein